MQLTKAPSPYRLACHAFDEAMEDQVETMDYLARKHAARHWHPTTEAARGNLVAALELTREAERAYQGCLECEQRMLRGRAA